MYRTTVTDVPLRTEGYFFSPNPFSHSDTIDALQLAIMLGTSGEGEPEVILVAVPEQQDTPYQLAIAGKLNILDAQGATVPADALRKLPLEKLNETTFAKKGWSLRSRPYFIWQRQDEPVDNTRSPTIYASVHHQLKTLSALM